MGNPKVYGALSYRQRAALERLMRYPGCFSGSCTNPTMCALERRGLVRLDWVELSSGAKVERWVLTDAGASATGATP